MDNDINMTRRRIARGVVQMDEQRNGQYLVSPSIYVPSSPQAQPRAANIEKMGIRGGEAGQTAAWHRLSPRGLQAGDGLFDLLNVGRALAVVDMDCAHPM